MLNESLCIMKTKNSISVISVGLFLGSMVFCNFTFGQSGKIWARIANFSESGIFLDGEKIASSNPAVQLFINELQVTTIEQALPAARTPELLNVYEISCACDEHDLLQAASRLPSIFQDMELAPVYELLYTPNDYSTSFTNDYALNLIQAEQAWDITKGDSNIVIGICDTHARTDHEELAGKYTYTIPPSSTAPTQHGTAVGIIAAGRTDNGLGKSSIGFNSKIHFGYMSYNSVLVAANSGAKVINLSWTSGCTYSAFQQTVMDQIYNMGVFIVAAAGNGTTCSSPTNLVYPAAYNNVFAVTSIGPYDNHQRVIGSPSSTHQHNSSVDLSAPGYDVALSYAPGTYTTGNGTSFAAPLVAGTAALLFAINPCFTNQQIELILKTSAVNIDSLNPTYAGLLGAGRLNAFAAVQLAASYPKFSVAGDVVLNCTDFTQSITLQVSHGTSPYQVVWENSPTNSLTLLDLQNNTSYSASVTDSMGCTADFSFTTPVFEPIDYSYELEMVTCKDAFNGSVYVFCNDTAVSYDWSTGSTFHAIVNLGPGVYDLEMVDSNNCMYSEQFIITEPAQEMQLTGQVGVNGSAYNSYITTQITGGTPPYSFYWSTGDISQNVYYLTPGSYELMVYDANGCSVGNLFDVGKDVADDIYSDNYSIQDGSRMPHQQDRSDASSDFIGLTVRVFPNPALQSSIISWEDGALKRVELVTALGQRIQEYPVANGQQSVRLVGVERGEYLVKLTSSEDETIVKRLTFL